MKKFFNLILAAALTVFGFSACEEAEEYIKLAFDGETVFSFGVDGGIQSVTVQSTLPISVTVEGRKTWLSIKQEENTIIFDVASNNQENDRSATVIISNGQDDALTFSIKQVGAIFEFLYDKEYKFSLEDAIDITLPVKTNYEFSISSSADWLKVSYNAEAGQVKISADPATADREAKVSFVAGPYNGEITIKQANAVSGKIDVYVTDYNANYTKENSVFFEIWGKNVTKGAVVLSTTAYLESEGAEYYQDILKTDDRFAFDAEEIADINSEEGYFNGFINLTPGTEYFVMAWLANDTSELFLTGTVTTEGDTPDPINGTYDVEDILMNVALEDYCGTYSLTTVFHWYDSSSEGYVYSNPYTVKEPVVVKPVADVELELQDGGTMAFKAVEFDGLYKNTLSTLYNAAATADCKDMKFFYNEEAGVLLSYGFDEGDFTFEFTSEPGVVYGGESMVVEDAASGSGYYSFNQLVAGFTEDGALTVVNIDGAYEELQLWGIEDGSFFGLYGLSDIIMTKADSAPKAPAKVRRAGNSNIEKIAAINAKMPVNYMETKAERVERILAQLQVENKSVKAVAKMN